MKTINLLTEPSIRPEDDSEMIEERATGTVMEKPASPARQRLKILVAVGAILLAGSAAGTGLVIHHNNEVVAEGTGDSKAGTSGATALFCLGTVDAENGVLPIFPAHPGRVSEVLVGKDKEIQESKEIKEGTVLFRLDDRLAVLDVKRADAALKAAQADLEIAVKAHERKKYLHSVKQLSDEELAASHELVNKAEAGVDAKQAELDQANLVKDECEVKAPAKGMVLRVLTAPGEVFGPHSRQPAMLFSSSGPRIVRAEVEQEFAGARERGPGGRCPGSYGGPGDLEGQGQPSGRLVQPTPFRLAGRIAVQRGVYTGVHHPARPRSAAAADSPARAHHAVALRRAAEDNYHPSLTLRASVTLARSVSEGWYHLPHA